MDGRRCLCGHKCRYKYVIERDDGPRIIIIINGKSGRIQRVAMCDSDMITLQRDREYRYSNMELKVSGKMSRTFEFCDTPLWWNGDGRQASC